MKITYQVIAQYMRTVNALSKFMVSSVSFGYFFCLPMSMDVKKACPIGTAEPQ